MLRATSGWLVPLVKFSKSLNFPLAEGSCFTVDYSSVERPKDRIQSASFSMSKNIKVDRCPNVDCIGSSRSGFGVKVREAPRTLRSVAEEAAGGSRTMTGN